MSSRILLKDGLVVDAKQNLEEKRDLLIEEGLIVETAPRLEAGSGTEIVDVSNKVVVPGFIDMHVHLREPGEEDKETIASGTRAGVAGGITSMLCMPNTVPPADNRQTVQYMQERAQRGGMARVYPVGTITRGREGVELTSFGTLLSQGVKAFSDDGSTVENSSVMYHALLYLRNFDALTISHCEEATLSRGGVAHEGYRSTMMGLQGLPAVGEELAVVRDLLLAKATGARLHLAHVSLAETVKWIKWAKEEGLRVTAEVTPHHLLLSDEALQGYNTMAKMKPPLRSEHDRQALVEAVRSGIIDVIATDHAPHRMEDKEGDFQEAAFGVSGLETAVPLLLTELVNRDILTIKELVKMYSLRPSEIVNIPGGSLEKGAVADLVVLDLNLQEVIDSRNFYSKGKNTPFHGWTITGKPVITMVAGKVKMKEGKIQEE